MVNGDMVQMPLPTTNPNEYLWKIEKQIIIYSTATKMNKLQLCQQGGYISKKSNIE